MGCTATGDQSDECRLVEEAKRDLMYEETGNEQGLSKLMGDLGTGKWEKGEETGIREVGLLTGDGNSVCRGDGKQETMGELLKSRVETVGSKS